jgi:hypothetical protein
LRQQIALERAFNAYSSELATILSPLLGQYGQTAEDRHVQSIAAAHPDYQTLTPGIVGWVEAQPAFVKNAYKQVLTEGATQDVVDLISTYKAAHGMAASAAPAPVAPTPAAQAAAAALAPVAARRSDPPAGAPDLNDFDSAFAEAARSLL